MFPLLLASLGRFSVAKLCSHWVRKKKKVVLPCLLECLCLTASVPCVCGILLIFNAFLASLSHCIVTCWAFCICSPSWSMWIPFFFFQFCPVFIFQLLVPRAEGRGDFFFLKVGKGAINQSHFWWPNKVNPAAFYRPASPETVLSAGLTTSAEVLRRMWLSNCPYLSTL